MHFRDAHQCQIVGTKWFLTGTTDGMATGDTESSTILSDLTDKSLTGPNGL
jgi:hypothetical protein